MQPRLGCEFVAGRLLETEHKTWSGGNERDGVDCKCKCNAVEERIWGAFQGGRVCRDVTSGTRMQTNDTKRKREKRREKKRKEESISRKRGGQAGEATSHLYNLPT